MFLILKSKLRGRLLSDLEKCDEGYTNLVDGVYYADFSK